MTCNTLKLSSSKKCRNTSAMMWSSGKVAPWSGGERITSASLGSLPLRKRCWQHLQHPFRLNGSSQKPVMSSRKSETLAHTPKWFSSFKTWGWWRKWRPRTMQMTMTNVKLRPDSFESICWLFCNYDNLNNVI